MKMGGQEEMSEDIKFLARGPLIQARRFSAYNVNGFKFRTISREQWACYVNYHFKDKTNVV